MILRVEEVSRSFGGLRALKGVTIEVAKGEILGLIGPNGAGKTTLLNLIAGVYKPHTGAIYLDGEDVTGLRPEALCKRGVSRTFQIPQSFPQLTALENVLVAVLFGNGRTRQAARREAASFLEEVSFPLSFETPAAHLNVAQLKRLDLARALASGPKLLLLDEIAAGVNPAELANWIQLIRRLRETGITVIIVEHLMRVIMQVCDRIVFLSAGEKLAEGTPAQIAADSRVISAYLGSET